MGAQPLGPAWWDHTWNPVGGCFAISPGCKHCYAAKEAGTRQTSCRVPLYEGVTEWKRGRPVFTGLLSVLAPEHADWTFPLRWRGADRPKLGDGQPSLIFVSDMADLFIEGRPEWVIDQVVATLVASQHIGLLLTKRPGRMLEYFSPPLPEATLRRRQERLWLGFSAERQQEFDLRWPHMRPLVACGFTVFVSVAPMLGPVVLPPDFLTHGQHVWVICSGEQNCGCGARYMHPDWALSLRDQCMKAEVPFFLLQMSGGADIPADLFVRQFPRRR